MNHFTFKATMLAAMYAVSALFSAGAQEKSLDIQVSDVSFTDGSVKITPSDESIGYYWYFRTKADFETIGADNIIESQINNWKNLASRYDDKTWQEMMFLNYGVTSTTFKEELSSGLLWDTEYVVYGFGMTSEGEVSAPLNYVEFKTKTPISSDNTFKVNILSVLPDGKRMTTTAAVTPSNDDPYVVYSAEKREVDEYDLTPGSQEEKEFCSMAISYGELHSGSVEVSFDQLRKDRDYCIVIVGVSDGVATTAPVIVEYRTEEKQPVKNDFVIEVTDIKPTSCHIKIVPPSEDMLWFWHFTTADAVEYRGGIETIDIKLDRAWYEYLADVYAGMYTWQELMKKELYTGSLEGNTSDPELVDITPDFDWDTDYVLYAYGVDEDCERITDIFHYEFRTGKPRESDLKFDFELVSVELDTENSTSTRNYYTVTVDIIPSDIEESYAFTYCETRFVDEYTDMHKFLYEQFRPDYIQTTDVARVVMTEIREGREYYIMAVGWEDKAPTTELCKFQFNSQSVGVESVAGEKVAVTAVDGGICIAGTYSDATVVTLDGRVVGTLNGDNDVISVPAGIYLVRYTEGERSLTTKVIVK